MGKIVKYCNSCDEGFASKFAFCPDCGKELEAFELNPVEQASPPAMEAVPPIAAETANFLEIPNEIAANAAPETSIVTAEEPVIDVAPAAAKPNREPVIKTAAPKVEETRAQPSTPSATPVNVFFQAKPVDADHIPTSLEDEHSAYNSEGAFYVTVIEEKNVKQRNTLLLGVFGLVLFMLMSGVVYSIFSKDLEVGAINEDTFLASLLDDVPMAVEEEIQQKRDKSAGGGGGGGRQEDETTQGDLANQTKNPERPPQALPRIDTTMPLPPASTQGNKTFDQTHDRYGDPNARFSSWNNGSGSGGGQGTGTGTGQGSGRGTGAGSGSGSGFGSGIGDGNGSGSGSGENGSGAPPPPRATVTQKLAITSKPRPGYTDSARQANIQGTVLLRVTFLGSGQIGSISPVKGLPNGLTEQAIAAARRISFQPQMVNGSPQTVTKQIEYTFSIY
jgi:TonB family protein